MNSSRSAGSFVTPKRPLSSSTPGGRARIVRGWGGTPGRRTNPRCGAGRPRRDAGRIPSGRPPPPSSRRPARTGRGRPEAEEVRPRDGRASAQAASPLPSPRPSSCSRISARTARTTASSTPRRFSIVALPAEVRKVRECGRDLAGLARPRPARPGGLAARDLGGRRLVVQALGDDQLGDLPLVVCNLQLGDLVGGRRLDLARVDPVRHVVGEPQQAEAAVDRRGLDAERLGQLLGRPAVEVHEPPVGPALPRRAGGRPGPRSRRSARPARPPRSSPARRTRPGPAPGRRACRPGADARPPGRPTGPAPRRGGPGSGRAGRTA